MRVVERLVVIAFVLHSTVSLGTPRSGPYPICSSLLADLVKDPTYPKAYEWKRLLHGPAKKVGSDTIIDEAIRNENHVIAESFEEWLQAKQVGSAQPIIRSTADLEKIFGDF